MRIHYIKHSIHITSSHRCALASLLLLLTTMVAKADELPYKCDFGVQGGLCYYVGDATPHVFQNIQWTAGAQFRYKFDPRWALQIKGQYDNFAFRYEDIKYQRAMINIDAVAEFNFFRFGISEYNDKIKPITPYIFLGIGMSIYNLGNEHFTGYFPFGFGLKYKPLPRMTLLLAWQHQLYFTDAIEGLDPLNNVAELNGSNILLNDLTSTLTFGIVFEFIQQRQVCATCNF